MSKFDFRPLSEQEKKMNDPAVKQAIRTLKVKGITIKQIEEAFRYYERLKGANANEISDHQSP